MKGTIRLDASPKGALSFKARAQNLIAGQRFRKLADESGALEALSGSPIHVLFDSEPGNRSGKAVQAAVEFWLRSLPASGVELAPELDAPQEVLQDVFQRGRLLSCHKGQRLQEEGAEVRNYILVLSGRCRMRCKAPVTKNSSIGKGKGLDDEEDVADGDGEQESWATCQVVNHGESLGLIPGEFSSGYDVLVADKLTMLLLLNAEDYAATLKPYHAEQQAEATEFLRRHKVCLDSVTEGQLKRLSMCMRQRNVHRGATVVRAGEPLRHVMLLRSGAAIVQVQDRPEVEVAGDGCLADLTGVEDDDEALAERRQRMRGLSGDRKLNTAAFDRNTHRVVSKYARGPLKAALKGEQKTISGPPGQRKGVITTARVQEPGTMLGEEVLLQKDFRDMVAACYNYTVQAVEDASFYVLDLTTFRQLLMLVGLEGVAHTIEAKLNRRVDQISRGDKVNKHLTKEARALQSFELQKQERQELRLPPSVGYAGAAEIENLDDWLGVVLEHRKKPPDMENPVTLTCLEAIGLKNTTSGPGVEAMLRVFSDPTALKEFRSSHAVGHLGRRAAAGRAPNPMGETIAHTAKYEEAVPPSRWSRHAEQELLPISDEAALLALPSGYASEPVAVSSLPRDGAGIFFQTEPELDDDMFLPTPPPAVSSTLPVPSALPPSGVPPRASNPSTGAANSRSASMPSLPKIGSTCMESAAPKNHLARSGSAAGVGSRRQLPAPVSTELLPREAAAKQAKDRIRHIMKAFQKAIPGKSILVFTDSKHIQRSVVKALLSPTDINLGFVRSTIELWQRLYEAREHYSALLLDLSKSELEVDSLLRTVKQHPKYAKLPIIVLSGERELPEVVRKNCSFVVFLPLAASTLREALLWCFDRQVVQQHCDYDLSYAPPQAEVDAWNGSKAGTTDHEVDEGSATLRIKAMGMAKPTKLT